MKWVKKNSISIILGFSLLLVGFLFWQIADSNTRHFSLLFLYLGVLTLLSILPKRKWLRPIVIVFFIPALIIRILYPFVNTFFLVFVLLLFSFGLLAVVLKYVPEYPFKADLNFASKFYILLVTGSTLITLVGSKIIQHFNSTFNSSFSQEQAQSQLNFTFTLANKEKIIFFIYFGYFIYLIPYSVSLLSDVSLFSIKNLDRSIFNAFITYTAFERVLANKDKIKIDFKGFLVKLSDAWK